MLALSNHDEGNLLRSRALSPNLPQRSEIRQCPVQKTQTRTRRLENIDFLGHSNQALPYQFTVNPSPHFKHRQRKPRRRIPDLCWRCKQPRPSSSNQTIHCIFFLFHTRSKGSCKCGLTKFLWCAIYVEANIYILYSDAGEFLHPCLLGLKHSPFERMILV